MNSARTRWASVAHLGWFFVVAAVGGPAKGDVLTVTSERMIVVPTPNAGGSATIFGSASATANADGNAQTNAVQRQAKLTAAGGPPATLNTNNVNAVAGPVTSPIVPATKAFAQSTIDTSGSTLNGANVTIDSKESINLNVSVGVPPNPPGVTMASASGFTRDPIILGTSGFGGNPVAAGSQYTMNYSLLGAGHVPHGGIWTSQEFIMPGAFPDPDTTITTPPPGSILFFGLTVDNTGPTKTVTFTPGTSNSNFTFSFSRTVAQIDADLLAFFGGAADLSLFSGTVTVNAPMSNVTLADQDQGSASLVALSVPEPSPLALALVGMLASLSVLKLTRRSAA
jgi:hypothetical protein